MDRVLRKIVQEEVKRKRGEEESDDESPQTKRNKTEGRLSNLLNKIRRKTNEKETALSHQSKPKRVQVKWKRFCPVKEMYKMVRSDNGGGLRIIEIPQDIAFTFGELKEKAIALYFSNGPTCTNKFFELREECSFQITFVSEDVIDDNISFWDYMQENCLVLSKTTFTLLSKKDNLLSFSMVNLCQICNSSGFLTEFGNCLKCLQDMPVASNSITCELTSEVSSSENSGLYNLTCETPTHHSSAQSSEILQLGSASFASQQQERSSSLTDSPAIISVPSSPELVPAFPDKPPYTVKIHRTKVKEDLIQFFLKQKVSSFRSSEVNDG